jgi:hypothetical protein
MRENRTYGSEGGETSNGKLPYPYRKGKTRPVRAFIIGDEGKNL